jgi:putative FmdB family regulatory protein
MPQYSFVCQNCMKEFDEFRSMSDNTTTAKCKCGGIAMRRYTPPSLVTDTSFCLTGKTHISLSERPDDYIEGRSDFNRRLNEKGLRVLDPAELEPKMPKPKPAIE